MTIVLLLLIAFSVAMDVTAVAASFALKRFSTRDITKLAITFGTPSGLLAWRLLPAFALANQKPRIEAAV